MVSRNADIMLYNCVAAVAGGASFCSETFHFCEPRRGSFCFDSLVFLLFHLLSLERITLIYVGEFVGKCMVGLLVRNVDYILGINVEFFYRGYF